MIVTTMTYSFDKLFQEFITDTGPDHIFGPPTHQGFADATYAQLYDAWDDGTEPDPKWIYIIETWESMITTP